MQKLKMLISKRRVKQLLKAGKGRGEKGQQGWILDTEVQVDGGMCPQHDKVTVIYNNRSLRLQIQRNDKQKRKQKC
jgi:hypothetical protein